MPPEETVIVTPGLMVSVMPGLTVQVSPAPMIVSVVIVASVVNVIDAASTSCGNPIKPKIKILVMIGTIPVPFNYQCNTR